MGKLRFRRTPASVLWASVLLWATAHGQVITYRSEADFVAAAGRFGYATFSEGFENAAVWDAARSPGSSASITSNGVVWTSNHSAALSRPGEITTGSGAARTGLFGIFASPHGNPDIVDPNGLMHDGFVGARTGGGTALYGVGGWFTAMTGARLRLILNGDESNSVDLGPIGADFQFLGVISSAPFAKFEIRETEGRLEDQKYVFGDDFTFATGGATVLESVSAASLVRGRPLAPGMIAAGFGAALSATSESATTVPLPTNLAGVAVRIRDSSGAEQVAPLFYVGPGQINYAVPEALANGPASLRVVREGQVVAIGTLDVVPVSPGLFAANADGKGVAAALAVTVAATGAQSTRYAYQCGSSPGSCTAAPIDLGDSGDQVFLVLFGTGIRGRGSASAMTIGGVAAEVTYAGAQGTLAGLDQVNVRLPGALRGRGDVEIRLNVDGQEANPLRLNVR